MADEQTGINAAFNDGGEGLLKYPVPKMGNLS